MYWQYNAVYFIIILMSCITKACCLPAAFVFSLSSLIMILCGVFFQQIAISQNDDVVANFERLDLITTPCTSFCQLDYFIEPTPTKCCTTLTFMNCREKQVCRDEKLASMREFQSTQQEEMYVMLSIAGVLVLAIVLMQIYKRRERLRREREELINHDLLDQNLGRIVESMRMREIQKRNAEEKANLFESFLYSDSVDNVCGICLNAFEAEKAIRLQCEHVFHSECLRKWLIVNDSCPFCRHKADP